MAKINRNGQAAILTETDQRRIISNLKNPKHRILFLIAAFTGERWGAILKLKVENVYENSYHKIPRDSILFPAAIRKKDKSGNAQPREVPTHPDLAYELERYQPPITGWLFPGHTKNKPLTFRCADKALRKAIAKAKLKHKGYSTHSTRRTFITKLYRRGADLKTLQQITGHKSIQSLERYIEADPQRKQQVIQLL